MNDTTKRLQHRIKIIKGQLAGLEKMIDDNAYCMDIVTQSLAAQRSLASLNKLVVARHIDTHIQAMYASADPAKAERATAELAQLYELANVRGK